MLNIGATGSGSAEVLALVSPACGGDFLLFTDESADLGAVVTAGAQSAPQSPVTAEDVRDRTSDRQREQAGE